MPSFSSPEPTVSCFDDLDFFKDFENEFPAIVYNDALISKSDFLTEPTLKPQHIDELIKDETSLLRTLMDDKVDIKHSSGDLSVKPLPDVINTDDVITEYLVNISKRRAFWSLNEDILKITILTTNTPYPSRKIRRIRACTHQRPRRKQAQYAVSREDQYAVLEI
ncbi:hypothetical protein Tco_1068519 [Tanacetum coccineum]|uniref:Uncharacterized protein n=1 Tax=Tanacetum coccineum TaxID=301880 RepID=A0ABQ5HHR3_9ASTR